MFLYLKSEEERERNESFVPIEERGPNNGSRVRRELDGEERAKSE